MKRFLIVPVIILATLNNSFGAGFQSLQLGSDGRSSGMGMVSSGLFSETGGYQNPADLVLKPGSVFMFSTMNWIEDVQTHFVSMSKSNAKQGIGLHVLYTDVSEIEHRLVASPEPIGVFDSHEMVAGISYAHHLNPSMTLGSTVHVLYEKLYIDEAWGLGIDLGITWKKSDTLPILSATIRNLGKTTQLKEESIQLPATVQMGLAYPFLMANTNCLAVLDFVSVKDSGFHMHSGIEYRIGKQLLIRGGYQTGYELRSFTGGIGIAWHMYRIDYAYLPLNTDFNDSHRISFTISR